MRMRSAWTGLLAAIVLCVSCSASTCALTCAMSGLHLARMAAAMAGAGAEHCGHAMATPGDVGSAAAVAPAQAAAMPCDGKLCGQEQLSAVGCADYQLAQPVVVRASDLVDAGMPSSMQIVARTAPDVLLHPPPKHFDILRL